MNNNIIEVEGVPVRKDSIVSLNFNTSIHAADYGSEKPFYYKIKVFYKDEYGFVDSGFIKLYFTLEERFKFDLLKVVEELLPKGNKIFTLEPISEYIGRFKKEEEYLKEIARLNKNK